jgi:hypothetical protein
MWRRGRGGQPMLRSVGVVGSPGRWCGAGGPTWKMTWGGGPTWWLGPRGRFEFKVKHESEFRQDLK